MKDHGKENSSSSSDSIESEESSLSEVSPDELFLTKTQNGSYTVAKKRKQPEPTTTPTDTTTTTPTDTTTTTPPAPQIVDDKEFRANIIPFSISLQDITRQLQNDSTLLSSLHKHLSDQLNRLKLEEHALKVQQMKKDNESSSNNFLTDQ